MTRKSPVESSTGLSSANGGGGTGEAIGSIVARPSDRFTNTSEAQKYLYCDGSTYSTSEYPKLYQVLGTTTLPDLRERFLEGSNIPNTYIESGLPNITGFGKWECIGYNYLGMYVGAFKEGSGYGSTYATSTGGISGYSNGLAFDASLSNSIYGQSDTVQPPAYTVRYYIRAK